MDRELNILVIDDELCRPERLSTLKAAYGELESREPPFVFHYETAEENRNKYGVGPALRRIELIPDLDVVVLDVMFGDQANRLGLDILEAVRQEHPLLPVIIMTSLEGEIEVVEKAMELGANEYLIKMPTLTELEETLRSYALPPTSEGRFAIWGNCSAIRHTRALIARVSAAGGLSVLVTGESGTGKELAARAIHRQGPRRGGRFVAKNCAFADLQLLDSDLFGHEKGAFTGADRQHVGRIERADKGVLFLDEIGSIVPALQGKLLRVLETGEFQRVGGTEDLRSDFQLICATNEDPEALLSEGCLREDFFYRVSQLRIQMPPLRDRKEDIPLLADLFLHRFRAGSSASYRGERFDAPSLSKLTNYHWPGNVRELKNVVERAAILARGRSIGTESLPPEIALNCAGPTDAKGDMADRLLPDDPTAWGRARIILELRMAVEAKRRSRSAAEFVRRLYPGHSKTSTAAVGDIIRRLTNPPWGDTSLSNDPEVRSLLAELER